MCLQRFLVHFFDFYWVKAATLSRKFFTRDQRLFRQYASLCYWKRIWISYAYMPFSSVTLVPMTYFEFEACQNWASFSIAFRLSWIFNANRRIEYSWNRDVLEICLWSEKFYGLSYQIYDFARSKFGKIPLRNGEM